MLTSMDRNLVVRVLRRLRGDALKQDANVEAALAAGDMEAAKARRAEAHRLHRDILELEGLKKRIEAQKAPATP